jgi:hypothetical protein
MSNSYFAVSRPDGTAQVRYYQRAGGTSVLIRQCANLAEAQADAEQRNAQMDRRDAADRGALETEH